MASEIKKKSKNNENLKVERATIITFAFSLIFILMMLGKLLGFNLDYVGTFEELGFGEWSEPIVVGILGVSCGLWYVFLHFSFKFLFSRVLKNE